MVFIFTRDFLDQASHGLATKVHFIYFDGGQWWVAKFRQRNIIEPNNGQRMIGKHFANGFHGTDGDIVIDRKKGAW